MKLPDLSHWLTYEKLVLGVDTLARVINRSSAGAAKTNGRSRRESRH